ncbi:hypothetical protein KP509_1Z149300 [Ceratopteris richardii]|nr:hypothetical protein KP509_1Z149300 [Ceratopteris richardii]
MLTQRSKECSSAASHARRQLSAHSDWNNRIRSVILQLASKIPYVGAIASFIVGSFLPQDKVDVFEAIKQDITNLIRKEILEYELNLHKSEIDGLKMIFTRYQELLYRHCQSRRHMAQPRQSQPPPPVRNYQLDKLEGPNYLTWVTLLLKRVGVWHITSGSVLKPDATDATY